MRVKKSQCVDITKQVIADMEANVTNPTTTTSAKNKSAEGPANTLQITEFALTKTFVPIHTRIVKKDNARSYGKRNHQSQK